MRKIILLILGILAIHSFSYAQFAEKRSQKLTEKAKQAEKNRQVEKALELYHEAVAKNDQNQEAWYRMAMIYRLFFSDRDSMLWSLENLIAVEAGMDLTYNAAYLHAADLTYRNGQYKKAEEYINVYLANSKPNERGVLQANSLKSDIVFSLQNQIPEEKKVKFRELQIPNAPPQIYFPELTPDKSLLLFTAMHQGRENIYASKPLGKNEWSTPISLSDNINTLDNEGAASISADGRILIFTACNRKGGFGSCDLYISRKEGSQWSRPENLGNNINSGAWESQPALSADGRSLYFVSDRKSGMGGRDIYVSYYQDDRWTSAVNLGPNVNTAEDEISPFIFADGKSLFFGSNGYSSFGGFDLYFTQRLHNDWQTPKNIGNHINNHLDQISIFVSSDKQDVFFSSEEIKGRQRFAHIYHTDMSALPGISLDESGFVKGQVSDANTQRPLAAKLQLYDLAKDSLLYEVFTDPTDGQYLMVLPYAGEFALYAEAKEYMLHTTSFTIADKSLSQEMNIQLSPLEVGAKMKLEHVFFEFDSYELDKKSITEIKKLAEFLINRPSIKIEIAGYTDSQGSTEYNLALSQKRADSVRDILLTYGISEKRIISKGYGADKVGKEGRRVEFVII